MTSETLQQDLTNASNALITMAEGHAWNRISKNTSYIITQENNGRVFINNKKEWQQLSELIPQLEELYPEIYDINLYIYKAARRKTFIEIRYTPLDTGYQPPPEQKLPMLHCKVGIPNYATDKKRKFDINWEHHTFEYRWFTFWSRLKFKLTGRF